jgi:hypothetical protein
MATAPGALPLIPTGIAGDEDAKKEYFEALNKQLQALESRKGYNLFNLAAALANPGRTGSFGEAMGNAAASLGADQQRIEAQELPIAQMRAQIAGQKYEMQNKVKAYGMVANVMGMGSPEEVARSLSSGQGLVGLGQKFTPEFYMALSRVDPKVAEYVKNAAGMDLDRFKAMQEAMKNNMSLAQMMDRFSPAVVKKFYELQGMPMPSPSAQTPPTTRPNAPTTASGQQTTSTPAGDDSLGADGVPTTAIRDSSGKVVDIGVTEEPSTRTVNINGVEVTRPAQGTATTPAAPALKESGAKDLGGGRHQLQPSGRIVFIDPTISPQDQRDRLNKEIAVDQELFKKENELRLESEREARSKRGEPYLEKLKKLAAYDYKTVQDYDLMNRELIQLVKEHPNTVGLLVRQGPVAAALQAAEVGVTTPFGQISAPVTEALQKLQLSPQEQAVARNIMQLVTQLNQRVMRDGKDIYGPQISVFDAREMSKPGFQTTDPASFITYLAMKNIITNKFLGEMANAQYRYFKSNRNASHSDFFSSENKVYTDIVDRLGATMRDLQKNSPFNK